MEIPTIDKMLSLLTPNASSKTLPSIKDTQSQKSSKLEAILVKDDDSDSVFTLY